MVFQLAMHLRFMRSVLCCINSMSFKPLVILSHGLLHVFNAAFRHQVTGWLLVGSNGLAGVGGIILGREHAHLLLIVISFHTHNTMKANG